MAEWVLLAMLVAAVLYAVLGGADFGAGMIEGLGLFGERARARVDVALAPVWEANHVWLVLIVVLTFVGFPQLYALISTYLHLPLLAALLGIVGRGAAFTFRHYDPSPSLRRWYDAVFRIASVLTPLSLGLVVAATASGTLPAQLPERGADFVALFVAPWNTWFGWASGLFVSALFAFEGAALLAAEQPRTAAGLAYLRGARVLHLCAIGSGGLVLLVAYVQDMNWLHALLGSAQALAALGGATLLIALVAFAFHAGRPWLLRLAMGAQMACVLFGFFRAQFPALLRTRVGTLGYQTLAAPPATLRTLLWAVAVGLVLIVPSVVYLIAIYKRPGPQPER